MEASSHIVRKQVVILDAPSEEVGQRLQQQVGVLYRQHILPKLDQCLTELADQHGDIRIDKLEIDLGDIQENEFHHQWISTAQTKLIETIGLYKAEADQQKAAREKNGHSENKEKPGDVLSLLHFFLTQGHLPWWADQTDSNIIHKTLTAIQEQPQQKEKLYPFLNKWCREERALSRLVNTFNDAQLEELIKIASPDLSKQENQSVFDIQNLFSVLTKMHTLSEIRYVYWKAIAAWVVADGQAQRRTQDELKILQNSIIQDLANTSELTSIEIDNLFSQTRGWADNESVTNNSNKLTLSTGKAKIQSIVDSIVREQLTESEKVWVVNAIETHTLTFEEAKILLLAIISPEDRFLTHSRIEEEQNIQRKNAIIEIQKLGEQLQAYYRSIRPNESTDSSKPNKQERESKTHIETQNKIEPDAQFSDSDEHSQIYINNAGLILFWPFLKQFLVNLELMDEQGFISEAAQSRAVVLLQALTGEAGATAEFQLVLNKILCGLSHLEVLTTQAPITKTEKAHCQEFINAILAHLSVLECASTEHLQHAYIQRNGILSQRDGVWLLRMEKQTHDILLTRLPWQLDWVKLPWMPTAINIEW